MTPEQRAAFIDSMVKGLADRQKAHPEDIDGWLRLANAYDKLGRADDAFTAWHEAATRAPDRLDTQIAYAAAGAVRAERGAPPADFEATVARLRQLAPDNPLGLYCAGLIAEAHGDKAAAKSFWQKLLPVLPEGSPQRQQIEARIAAWGIEPPKLPNALGKAAPASEYSAMNYPIKAQPQLTIPAGWYHGPEIFERERRQVFAREWQFLGPVSQLANPGDYIATEITGWRVFVIRDREGALRGFHNLCRHRAGHFMDDGIGHCEVLRCKYHGWVYGADGRLRATPAFGEAPWFDKKDYPLLPIQVGEWRGLLFVNLDLEAKPLSDCLGALPELTQPYPMESFTCLKQVEFEISCNWKTYTDNFVEGYHIPSIHPWLNAKIDFSRFETYRAGECRGDEGAAARGLDLWRGLALGLSQHDPLGLSGRHEHLAHPARRPAEEPPRLSFLFPRHRPRRGGSARGRDRDQLQHRARGFRDLRDRPAQSGGRRL